jgi:hypothetical protein
VPFEAVQLAWPSERGKLARRVERARVYAHKGRRYAKRRVVGTLRRGGETQDPFAAVHAYVKRAAADEGSPAWEYLNRDRVNALLGQNPARMHSGTRDHLGRLAMLFAASGRRDW